MEKLQNSTPIDNILILSIYENNKTRTRNTKCCEVFSYWRRNFFYTTKSANEKYVNICCLAIIPQTRLSCLIFSLRPGGRNTQIALWSTGFGRLFQKTSGLHFMFLTWLRLQVPFGNIKSKFAVAVVALIEAWRDLWGDSELSQQYGDSFCCGLKYMSRARLWIWNCSTEETSSCVEQKN